MPASSEICQGKQVFVDFVATLLQRHSKLFYLTSIPEMNFTFSAFSPFPSNNETIFTNVFETDVGNKHTRQRQKSETLSSITN